MSKKAGKAAAKAIGAEMSHYKRLDSFLEGCQVISFDWRYLYLNKAAVKHARRKRQELIGKTMMEAYPGIENTGLFHKLERCMVKRTQCIIENEFIYPDGVKGYFELRVEPVREGLFILSIDVTRRKKAMERSKYLNASLLALRNVNQLITKEKNRGKLIRKSCSLMVKERGFLLAWIALTGENGVLIDAAAAGSKEMTAAFLEQLKRGEYPPCFEKIQDTGERQSYFCGDIPGGSHDCLPGRISADATGFVSRLEYKGEVYGVISVYLPSGIEHDPQEISLLHELVGDISYALYSIRIEEQHKKAEEALHNSESLYRSLFENMLNGFAYCKMLYRNRIPYDFKYIAVNKAFTAQTGLKDVVGKKVSEVIPGLNKTDPELMETYGRVAQTGIPRTFEIYIKNMDMWFSVSAYSPKKGYFVALFDVITERKNAEESMRFANVLLSTQMESSIDGILVVSDNGKVLSYNKRFLDMWDIPGRAAKNGIVLKVINMMADKVDDREKFLEKMENLCANKDERSRDEVELIESRILDMYSSPMLGPDKRYYGRVWYFRDITDRRVYEDELKKSYLSLKKNLGDVIDTIGKIAEMRDPYTAGHQKRVAYLAVEIAKKLGLDREQLEEINMSAMIHDIGKIHIPSSILTKPGKLTDLEFSLIRTHPEGGYGIIRNMDFPVSVAQTVLQHHERLDGSGYPKGLGKKDICLGASIIAVADVVEAMASHRPYRPALGIDLAIKEVKKGRGIRYDADVADACLAVISGSGFRFDAGQKDDYHF